MWHNSPSLMTHVLHISNIALGSGVAFLFFWDPEDYQYSFAC